MKPKIHPQFYTDARVTCACGTTFVTSSTKRELRVEVCSKCHPFLTGDQRLMDTEGRVERLKRRFNLK